MQIVTASMHYARLGSIFGLRLDRRRVRQIRFLGNRQGIEIRSEHNRRTIAIAKQTNNSVTANLSVTSKPASRQILAT